MCMKYEDSDFIKKFIDSSFSSNLSSLSLYKNLGKMTADALWLNIRWQKIFNNVLWSVKKIVKKLRIFKGLPKSHLNYFIYKKISHLCSPLNIYI